MSSMLGIELEITVMLNIQDMAEHEQSTCCIVEMSSNKIPLMAPASQMCVYLEKGKKRPCLIHPDVLDMPVCFGTLDRLIFGCCGCTQRCLPKNCCCIHKTVLFSAQASVTICLNSKSFQHTTY